jgi:Tol biopolymer transport system component
MTIPFSPVCGRLPFVFAVAIWACAARAPDDAEWGNLRNLGPDINSTGKDEHATLTGQGNTMYFASIREGGLGGYDLYVSHLEHGEWAPAELLPPPLNTAKDEYDPFITLDGKRLFFASSRDNSDAYVDADIYVSELIGGAWTEPMIYDSLLVTPGKPDWGFTATRDFRTLVFSSGRAPARARSAQIFQSRWLGAGWSIPEALPWPVNSGTWEATPFITPDGSFLYLNSARGKSDSGDVDIWRFEWRDGRWTNAHLMTGPFLSSADDYDPCLSADGERFYFTSTRPGGLGGADIYVVERLSGGRGRQR